MRLVGREAGFVGGVRAIVRHGQDARWEVRRCGGRS